MGFKTIVIVVLTILVTVVLMNNTDEMDFWIFGDARIPKLAMMGAMFGCGLIVGFLAGRPRRRSQPGIDSNPSQTPDMDRLSPEDREFIS